MRAIKAKTGANCTAEFLVEEADGLTEAVGLRIWFPEVELVEVITVRVGLTTAVVEAGRVPVTV
jgi:hypothetical protein